MIQPRVSSLGVAALILMMEPAFGEPAYIPLEQRITQSSVIAIVEISATIRSSDRISTPRGRAKYHQVAVSRVLRVLKGGVGPGEAVEIHFDTGMGCPNVLYEAHQQYLVFLESGRDGKFVTVNLDGGQYKIKDGVVMGRAVELPEPQIVEVVTEKLADMISANP